jgi:hypothetical protein
LKQIARRLIESISPQVIAAFRIDQLDIDADSITAALNAALKDIFDP